MKINEVYACKIYLFGELDDEGDNFRYIKNVMIGRKELSEIINEKGDVYYIDNELTSSEAILHYNYTRKDIIQVNDVMHPDFK
ncbi:hypothetical protein P0E51_05110 [Enterococcus faecalis]|uniref:hypothetical protein n=1 Tax=Enterococcus faecalis TaxID=1351 RepID=UPI0025B251C5|nr:hypothetical protein [Enterococcus faecalis]MDN3075466.1 hypothetical protein [Enterococcus faecalis]